MRKPKFFLNTAAIAVGCLLLAACGGSSSGADESAVDVVVGEPVPQPDTGDEGNSETLTNVSNDDPDLFVPGNIIADFEDVAYMQDPANGWVLTGVFAEVRDWRGVTVRDESARVGQAAVSTCEIGGNDCDSNTGSILTPPFTVHSDYINFLMSGGATAVGLELRAAGSDTVLVAYQPNSCDRPHITDDDDWHHLDVRSIRGVEVQLYLFDHEEGGCGFVSFDHFYQSSMAIGTEGGSALEDLEGFNVSIPDDAQTNVISSFDDALVMIADESDRGEGWLAEGDFSNPDRADAWEGRSAEADAARIGDRAFSSCATGGDACEDLVGAMTSAAFEVTRDYIRFLAVGGSTDNDDVSINILHATTNEVLASFTPQTCDSEYITGDDDWYQFDVSEISGQAIKFQIVDASTEECGFISVDHAYQTNSVTFEGDGGEVTPGHAGTADIPTEFQSWNVDLAPDAFDEERLIGNFDSPSDMLDKGWTATGAFADPVDDSAWQGTTQSGASARVGYAAVGTCEMNDNAEGCDAPMGRLTSPLTTVLEDYLYFLMKGGDGGDAQVGFRVLDSIGNILHDYTPASCGPSHIDSNDDWTYIDQSAIRNAVVHYQFYDEEDGGCGFLSFDHLYQSDRDPNEDDGILPINIINGGVILIDDEQLASIGFNASLPYADSNEVVLGRFDDAEAMLDDGWVATGDFASPAGPDAWQGTTSADASARIGSAAVSTCEINDNADDCDTPTGTLTSPTFTVDADKPLLVFMMAGGNGGDADVGLRVISAADSSELASYTPDSCGPSHISGDDDWAEIDLSAYAGEQVQIEIFDHETGGCGFLSFDHLHMSDGEAYVPD